MEIITKLHDYPDFSVVDETEPRAELKFAYLSEGAKYHVEFDANGYSSAEFKPEELRQLAFWIIANIPTGVPVFNPKIFPSKQNQNAENQ